MGKSNTSKRFRRANPGGGGGGGGNRNNKRSSYKKPGQVKRLQEDGRRNAAKVESKMDDAQIKNPFELRMNKRKHDVMGKVARFEKGMPGVSRAKANEKRKGTLLKEYKHRSKTNLFIDRRIGEKNKGISEEDKFIRRSAAEKSKQYKKKSIFSLGDEDELLTHKGKPLTGIDRYEDPREQSDSEDELLSEAFVGDANFGGGFLRKKKEDSDIEDDDDDDEVVDGETKRKKSRDEIIAELILASKKRKFEKAKETDENYEKIQSLDSEFKSLEFKNLLNQLQAPKKVPKKFNDNLTPEELLQKIREEDRDKSKKPLGKEAPKAETRVLKPEIEPIDYDRLVKELQFETKKARPSDLPSTGAQQIVADREELQEQLKEINDLSSELKSEISELLELIFSSKGGDKTKLPDVLSNLLDFFMKHVEYFGEKKIDNESASKNNDVACKLNLFSNSFKSFCDILIPQIHSLFVANTVGCTKRFLEHLVQAQADYQKRKSRLVSVKTVALLQLAVKLFPTLDGRNAVLSPAANLLLEVISQGKMLTSAGALRVLHCVCIFYELVEESKRYAPEIISLLRSLLLCFCPRNAENTNLMVPNVRKAQSYLGIGCESAITPEPELTESENHAMSSSDSECETDRAQSTSSKQQQTFLSNESQSYFLVLVLNLVEKYAKLYEYLPSSPEIFHPISTALLKILESSSSVVIQESRMRDRINSIKIFIENLKGQKEFLRVAAEKPKPLRLYEPLIEDDFDGTRKRHNKLPRQKQEEARLAHKVKKEFKSAVREIKKDSAFLAREQLREQMASDAERKRKVKELLGSLANQEGDYQKLKRKK